MQLSPSLPASRSAASEQRRGYLHRLLYHWFVEYNPLYLVSAALVLGGCFLWSRGLVQNESLTGQLGIAFVAELYAASLIAGAALLTRIGLKRPAVMLALIAVLYQWDTTLHLETCAYLGAVGTWAAALWSLVFAGKVYALGWALHLRFDRRTLAAALIAAAGLALGPRVLPALGGRGAGALLAVWVFALGALYRKGGIRSLVDLDAWGRTVLSRATRAAWLLSGAVLGLHVLSWCTDHVIFLTAALLTVPLLFIVRIRSEARMWPIALGTLLVAAWVEPGAFFVTSLLAAAALCLRAIAPAFASILEAAPPDAKRPEGGAPYRAANEAARAPDARSFRVAPMLVEPAERARCFAGALFAAYLAAWTLGWSNGPWPSHIVALDVALAFAVALFVWRTRTRAALLPLAASTLHFAIKAGLLPRPTGSVAWGKTAIAFGFVLLFASLFTSYRTRAYAEGRRLSR
jgi:hypothetical protein